MPSLSDVEFKVFSQWGDDGIIQWLISKLDIPNKTFIEFGVGNYRESNTRFLMMNDNWSGLVMDSSKENIEEIKSSQYYWRYSLEAQCEFVDCETIDAIVLKHSFHKDLGLLHIDIDGNDYWVWKSIKAVNPVVAIIEYNSLFGSDRAITVPHDKNFRREKAHYSSLYFGASLPAFCRLGAQKGYVFVGCNSAGNNAYFVRKDKMTSAIRELSPQEGYVLSKSRQSRDREGRLTYLSGEKRLEEIKGLPVYNVDTDSIEKL